MSSHVLEALEQLTRDTDQRVTCAWLVPDGQLPMVAQI